jgi:hypothetical protein
MKKRFRRWLFRRLFPSYRVFDANRPPHDRDLVVILDVENRKPVWIARYNAEYKSFEAGGGWFEYYEIDYWSPMTQLEHPHTTHAPRQPAEIQ